MRAIIENVRMSKYGIRWYIHKGHGINPKPYSTKYARDNAKIAKIVSSMNRL